MSLFPLISLSAGLLCAAQLNALTLDGAVEQALEQNFSIRLSELSVATSEENLTRAEANFDPTLTGRVNYNERLSPGNQTDQSGNSNPSRESVSTGVSVSKRTGLGTQLSLSSDTSYSSFSEDTETSVGVNIRQPLLGGAGKTVNLANVFRARVRSESALLSYRSDVLDTLQETVNGYWAVALSQERSSLLQSSLEVAENLLKESRRRLELGLATDLQVLQAEASLASRKQALLNAELAIEAAYDDLWMLLGREPLAGYGEDPVSVPDYAPAIPDELTWYPEVISKDLDLRIIENSLAILRRDREVARRNLLPQVDLSLNARALGREESASEALSSALDRDGYAWGAGISVSVPWGRRADKAQERIAQIELREESTRRERLEYDKRKLARQVVRDLESTIAQLEISETQVVLRERLFERERAGYRAGSQTFKDVLEAQESLDQARLNRIDILRRAMRQDTLRARLDHELFDRFQISFDVSPRSSGIVETTSVLKSEEPGEAQL